MTHDERLDIALRHLLKYNAGSFVYYQDIENDPNKNSDTVVYHNNEDRLIRHFKDVGIEEKYHMPIIYHLIGDGYVKPVWSPPTEEEKGQPPKQIMITFKGISFIDDTNGGYVKKKRKEEAKRDLELAQTWAIAIGTTLAGLWTLYEFIKALQHSCCCINCL